MAYESKNETCITKRNIYWVGSRYSDCFSFSEMLAGSVCLYGKTNGNDIALSDNCGARFDNNNLTDDVNAYVKARMFDIAKRDEKAAFYFYNPGWKFDIGGFEEIENRLLCVNKKELYDFYDSKINVYQKYSNCVQMIDCRIFHREECTYENFERALGESKDGYIVQSDKASGGLGTLVVDKKNSSLLLGLRQEKYIVSRYEKQNIPVNYHAVIYDKDILILPGSIQIQRLENNHLIYKGADYAAYGMIAEDKRKALRQEVRKACLKMQSEGYRGVVGLDGMIYRDRIAVIELNTRFQGSTAALNIGLKRLGYKTVQELNLDAFYDGAPSSADRALDNDFEMETSCYFYGNISPKDHSDLILNNLKSEKHVLRLDADGYTQNDEVQEGIYKFRVCFDANICAPNSEGSVWLHENVCEPDMGIYDKVCKKDPLALKITLMTQGVRIREDAATHLRANGGIRAGNNNAVDIFVCGLVVNAPCAVEFNAFAPYEICLQDGKLALYYYNTFIDYIKLYPLDPLAHKYTKSGRKYSDIAYLSTDRLRIHMTDKCIYKKLGKSCRFCNIDTEESGKPITMEEIAEVVEDYLQNSKELKHFLVGGQSAEEYSDKTKIVDMIKTVRERTDKNIYVMCLPFSKKTIEEMAQAGMTELACNIEVLDKEIAIATMPGKGRIDRARYFDILGYAKGLLLKDNAVRSAVIIGLEPYSSFMFGIEELLDCGIQPILSVFRPLPETELARLMSPPATYLYDLFIELLPICESYNLPLGPDCVNCQNNTLSLPKEIAQRYLRFTE